jgi:hypothetical protein
VWSAAKLLKLALVLESRRSERPVMQELERQGCLLGEAEMNRRAQERLFYRDCGQQSHSPAQQS